MRGVDLSIYRFDYDLTLAVLFMHSDGQIYHQYGNRISAAADSGLSMSSLEHVMRGTLLDHELRQMLEDTVADPSDLRAGPSVSVETLPAMARREKAGKGPDCYHCHMVNQAFDEDALEKGTFDPAVAWRYPPSSRIGLTMDRDDQQRVTAVEEGSSAAAAGIRAGHRLTALNDRSILSEGDIQAVLEALGDAEAGDLRVHVETDPKGLDDMFRLELEDGWRVGAPDDLWRATMWRLDPRPGFGGPMLDAAQKKELGIDEGVSAFRVNYVVTWGTHARTGKSARKAGLRKHDVVLSAAGKDDFKSPVHFHAWFRLTRKVGDTVPIVILRKGERKTIDLPVIE
jgi:serine protease Do